MARTPASPSTPLVDTVEGHVQWLFSQLAAKHGWTILLRALTLAVSEIEFRCTNMDEKDRLYGLLIDLRRAEVNAVLREGS